MSSDSGGSRSPGRSAPVIICSRRLAAIRPASFGTWTRSAALIGPGWHRRTAGRFRRREDGGIAPGRPTGRSGVVVTGSRDTASLGAGEVEDHDARDDEPYGRGLQSADALAQKQDAD